MLGFDRGFSGLEGVSSGAGQLALSAIKYSVRACDPKGHHVLSLGFQPQEPTRTAPRLKGRQIDRLKTCNKSAPVSALTWTTDIV
jgi:hypothetical protein